MVYRDGEVCGVHEWGSVWCTGMGKCEVGGGWGKCVMYRDGEVCDVQGWGSVVYMDGEVCRGWGSV